jgi:hypothetical protein
VAEIFSDVVRQQIEQIRLQNDMIRYLSDQPWFFIAVSAQQLNRYYAKTCKECKGICLHG